MYTTEDLQGISGKYVSRFGRGFSRESQEDMQQDIILAMLTASQQADEEKNPEAFICKSGRNAAFATSKWLARNRRRNKAFLNDPIQYPGYEAEEGEKIDLLPAPDTECDTGILESERTSAIASAVASLPTVQANAVKRVLQEGATCEAFGRENGFTKERARQILDAAKATLALRLKTWEPVAC